VIQTTELFLSNINIYGPWIMGLGFLISAAGLPIPITPIVVAAGAAVQQFGGGSFDLFVWGFVGVVVGDSLCFLIGRLAMEPIERLTPARFQPMWQKVSLWFSRSGGTAVFLSRWLLNSVDVPLSMVAGGAGLPFARFAQSILAGRMLWFVLYGGLGFALGAQWQQFTADMQAYQSWIGGIIAVMAAFYFLLKTLRKNLIPTFPEA
jgi:membrane-associated protein